MVYRVYYCYYCNNPVILEALLKIDEKLKKLDPEDHEYILDNLPKSGNLRVAPFIHKSDLGYEVLNICTECFNNAKELVRK